MSCAANIYNDLILGYVIFTFNKLDLFPLFDKGTSQEEIAQNNDYDPKRFSELILIAKIMGVLQEKNGKLVLTELGRDIEKNRGFFTWAIGGYSPLLESMDTFVVRPVLCA